VTRAGRLAILVVGALLLVGLAWVGLRPANTEPVSAPIQVQQVASKERAVAATPAVGPKPDSVSEAPHADVQDTDLPSDVDDGPAFVGPGPSERRTQRIEGAVHLLLGRVAPELDLTQMEQRCAGNGRRCTFSGPWPGDDFLGRWVRATADGQIASADLEGVIIERFEPVENELGELNFEIIGTLPRPERP